MSRDNQKPIRLKGFLFEENFSYQDYHTDNDADLPTLEEMALANAKRKAKQKEEEKTKIVLNQIF